MNEQEKFWSGEEGKSYLQRNFQIGTRFNDRKQFYDMFESIEDKNISILEAGCNCGINLQILKELGFNNLSGIDIGSDALAEAKRRLPDSKFYQGSILDMPFQDGQFDMIFTSGVLIHQDPDKSLDQAMTEIYRCSNKYILGLEDYSEQLKPIKYRSTFGFLWNAPYDAVWTDKYKDLEVLKTYKFTGSPKRIYYKMKKAELCDD